MVEKLLNLSRSRRIRMFAFTLGVIVLTLIIYFPNYARLKKLRDENQRLSLDNQKLIAEIADYEEKLQRVGKDPYLYEKIAREELGIAKEGEIVIDIEE